MSFSKRTRTPGRRTRTRVFAGVAVGLVVLAAATVAALGGLPSAHLSLPAALDHIAAGAGRSLGADGSVPDGVTVFDDRYAAVTKLRRDLLDAVRAAATDAAHDGVTFYVNSGWRSPSYQNQLLREAVAEYGSAAEAARWVATAQTSPHVQGKAIDIGEWDAATWLSDHGAAYGLCQIYANEPWHFELRPGALDDGCPDMYADPTYDPRMKQ
ncbi:M15 family metallopeptidase [Diaminobutyricibacter sp. McL0608]|uniref:M15 family metallopeptidase n=1 Tax=Leifsonia sp. McL0608 TaxID=3143537 RepID=UPI0031F2F8FC